MSGSHFRPENRLCGLLIVSVNTTIILAHLVAGHSDMLATGALLATVKLQHQHQQQSTQTPPLLQPSAAAPPPPPPSPALPETSNKSEDKTSLPEQTNALAYLQRYGYMQPPVGTSNNHLISEESFSSAILDFQRFAGLTQTGLVDNQTLAMMRRPRCGNIDKQPTGASALTKMGQLARTKRRIKRYALQGSKWRRQELTYRISQYPTKFAGGRRHEVEAQIEKAFGIWSQVAPIDFVVKREGRVHIDIRFASGDHGDGDAFDGPGNTLAHAYFPQYGGDAHFDDQEYWTVDSYAGTNIFQVAAHELGHSLGLGHSNVREALMAPFYQKYKPNFRLHLDDVLAIQALYGEKADRPPVMASTTEQPAVSSTAPATQRPLSGRHPPIYKGKGRPALGRGDDEGEASTTTTTTTTTPSTAPTTATSNTSSDQGGGGGSGGDELPELPTNGIDDTAGAGGSPADLCSDSALDAITRTEDGSTYVFKGDHYWLLTSEGLARGYPRPISADWSGLPGNLDAALTWADGKTFFFKGNKYWRFRDRKRDLGYPKLISAGFAGIPDDVDAAFVWSGNGRTYFFKGTEYWRFDSKADPPVSAEYPRPIKVWLGVPAYVNAAFKWENNVTYFFKGNHYYRFNDREFRVEPRGRPSFPRPTSEWWFGCVNSNLAQRALAGAGHERNFASEHSALVDNELGRTTPHKIRALLQQGGAGPAPSTNGDEWAFLAGLGENETRPMGTHISDHHQQGEPHTPRTIDSERESTQQHQQPAGERATRAGEPFDANFVASINRRLVPPDDPLEGVERAFRMGPRLSSASSATSAIFITLPSVQLDGLGQGHSSRLFMFLCTMIATTSTSMMSLSRQRHRWRT